MNRRKTARFSNPKKVVLLTSHKAIAFARAPGSWNDPPMSKLTAGFAWESPMLLDRRPLKMYVTYVASYVRITTWHDHQSSSSLYARNVKAAIQTLKKKSTYRKHVSCVYNFMWTYSRSMLQSRKKNTGLPFQLDCWYPAELPNKLVTMPTDTGRFVNP